MFKWFFTLLIGFTSLWSPVSAQENTYTYNSFSLILPEGWVKQDVPTGSQVELVGVLKSTKMRGTVISIYFYNARHYSIYTVRSSIYKALEATYTKGLELIKKETKLKTDGGLTAYHALWRGALDAAPSIKVYCQIPTGIINASEGLIHMIGFAPDSTGAQLDEDFMKMIQTAK